VVVRHLPFFRKEGVDILKRGIEEPRECPVGELPPDSMEEVSVVFTLQLHKIPARKPRVCFEMPSAGTSSSADRP